MKNEVTAASSPGSLRTFMISDLAPASSNPRMKLELGAFLELKKSIRKNGLLQPIAVRAAGDAYEIVGGHRRYHAVKELAHEHPNDARFATIAALVVDAAIVALRPCASPRTSTAPISRRSRSLRASPTRSRTA